MQAMISLGNLCSFLEVFLCHNLFEVYHMLPQHQAYDLLLSLRFLQIPQDPLSCSFLLTERLKSFCSSQLESLTHSSSFSLHIQVTHSLPSVSLSSLPLCVFVHAFFSSPGRFWTCPIPYVKRNSGQKGPTGKLHFVLLRVEDLLSP
jgi:hypothetical protein